MSDYVFSPVRLSGSSLTRSTTTLRFHWCSVCEQRDMPRWEQSILYGHKTPFAEAILPSAHRGTP